MAHGAQCDCAICGIGKKIGMIKTHGDGGSDGGGTTCSGCGHPHGQDKCSSCGCGS